MNENNIQHVFVARPGLLSSLLLPPTRSARFGMPFGTRKLRSLSRSRIFLDPMSSTVYNYVRPKQRPGRWPATGRCVSFATTVKI